MDLGNCAMDNEQEKMLREWAGRHGPEFQKSFMYGPKVTEFLGAVAALLAERDELFDKAEHFRSGRDNLLAKNGEAWKHVGWAFECGEDGDYDMAMFHLGNAIEAIASTPEIVAVVDSESISDSKECPPNELLAYATSFPVYAIIVRREDGSA